MRVMLLLSCLLVASCTATDILEFAKPKGGIDTSVQLAGEEANKQIILGDQSKHTVKTDDVAGDLNSTSNKTTTQFTGNIESGSFTINNLPTKSLLYWGGLIIFFLGVLFPSPFEIWRWFKTQLGLIRKGNDKKDTKLSDQ